MQCVVCERISGVIEVQRLPNFKILRCQNCGLEFADPMACNQELYNELYSDPNATRLRKYTGFAVQLNRWDEGIPKGKGKYVLKYYERAAINILQKRFSKNAYILDVGCGSGRFLAALRDLDFRSLGMDIAAEPVETLKRLGFTVAQGTIKNFPKHWPCPKAITLFEVLEHLPDPLSFLTDMANRFPDSLLLLSVPSPKRWYLWNGKREPEDYPPNHLTRWTEKSLKIALERAGYKKVEIKFMPVRATEITGSGIGEFLFSLTSRPVNKISKNDSPKKKSNRRKYHIHPVKTERILGILKRLFYLPLAWYLNAKGFSGISMLAVAEIDAEKAAIHESESTWHIQ